jgi:hypothetical protein
MKEKFIITEYLSQITEKECGTYPECLDWIKTFGKNETAYQIHKVIYRHE